MLLSLTVIVLLLSASVLNAQKRCRHWTVNGQSKRQCVEANEFTSFESWRTPKDSIRNLNPFEFMSLNGDDFNDELLNANENKEEEPTNEDKTGATCGLRAELLTGARVVGGRKAYKNEFPWMVGIQYKSDDDDKFLIRGGGSILNKRWIVTAAHVFDGDYTPSHYNGILDTLDTNNVSITVYFDKIVIYPDYDNKTKTFRNDIALMHTTEDMVLYPQHPGVNSVCLPEASKKFNGIVTVSGYGNLDEEGTQTDRLMTVNLFILDDNICRRIYRRLYNRRIQICAGYLLGKKDSCKGDSGGPLVQFVNKRAYLVGIVSFGEDRRCARKGSGAVYSKLTYYLKWIQDNIS